MNAQKKINLEILPGGLVYRVNVPFTIPGSLTVQNGFYLKECRDGFFSVMPNNEEGTERLHYRIGASYIYVYKANIELIEGK